MWSTLTLFCLGLLSVAPATSPFCQVLTRTSFSWSIRRTERSSTESASICPKGNTSSVACTEHDPQKRDACQNRDTHKTRDIHTTGGTRLTRGSCHIGLHIRDITLSYIIYGLWIITGHTCIERAAAATSARHH